MNLLYINGHAGENPTRGQVIFAVATPTTGQAFKMPTWTYAPALISSPNVNQAPNYDWYWKPVIQFIPQLVKNYD